MRESCQSITNAKYILSACIDVFVVSWQFRFCLRHVAFLFANDTSFTTKWNWILPFILRLVCHIFVCQCFYQTFFSLGKLTFPWWFSKHVVKRAKILLTSVVSVCHCKILIGKWHSILINLVMYFQENIPGRLLQRNGKW